MKKATANTKINRAFRVLLILLIVVLTASGCAPIVRDYTGTPLSLLSFKTIDYMGGYTQLYIFDFEANVAQVSRYMPDESEQPQFEIIATFSDAEEDKLIDKLYSYGLFSIKANYPAPPNIFDGGGWNLTIEYSDGTTKESKGSNNSPTFVFRNCAKAFYDICRDGIVANVPQEYYCPPNISYAFEEVTKTGIISWGATSYGERVNYQWNGFSSTGNSIYKINATTDFPQEFYEGDQYNLVLYTANYGKYERFQKCIVTTYDYNEELTNPTTVYSSRWFKQTELPLELNKIYLVRFEYITGDFVEYTFNTKTTPGERPS